MGKRKFVFFWIGSNTNTFSVPPNQLQTYHSNHPHSRRNASFVAPYTSKWRYVQDNSHSLHQKDQVRICTSSTPSQPQPITNNNPTSLLTFRQRSQLWAFRLRDSSGIRRRRRFAFADSDMVYSVTRGGKRTHRIDASRIWGSFSRGTEACFRWDT